MNSIGRRLREARLARGLTQEQLARGLATKGFISQVERDQATPSLAKLRLLAERLSLPLSGLTGEHPPLDLSYLRKSAELAVKANEAERALSLVAEAEPHATTPEEQAELLRIRGRALDELGRLAEALDSHQQAAATAPADEPELNGEIYAEIATVLNQLEQFNAAVEAGRRALQWLDRSKHADPALRSRVLSNLGRSCFGLGQLQRAHRFYEEALSAGNDAESLYRIANARMSLGVTARATGNLDEAIEHCNRALEIWGRIQQARNANRVLNNVGDVYYAQGKTAQARAVQRRCLEQAKILHDDLEVAIAGAALARYDYEQGALQESARGAQESQRAAARSGAHLHQAYAAAVEAAAAARLGQRHRARRKFREAVTILLEREAAEKLAQACTLYADALRATGEENRAFELLGFAAARDFSKLPGFLRARA